MNLEPIHEFSLAGVSALIVEDETLIAHDVENLLREFGAAQVWSTGLVTDARRILTGNRDIAIVLLDLKLQDGCGEQLLPELCARKVPVIVTTGYSAFTSALAPVIYKPYSTEGLLKKILEVLRYSGRQGQAWSSTPHRPRHSRAAVPVRPTGTRRRLADCLDDR
jgi:DNA-binding NtrC family response regulator